MKKDFQKIINEQHENIQRDMKDPRVKEAVEKAKEILRTKEKVLEILPDREEKYTDSKDMDEILECRDSGDVWFMFQGVPVPLRCEVKRHKDVPYWTDLETYPYPNLFVDSKKTYDSKIPRPTLYMIFNKDLTSFCTIDIYRTRDKFFIINAPSGRGYNKDYYAIKKELAKFFLTKQLLEDKDEKHTEEDLFTD